MAIQDEESNVGVWLPGVVDGLDIRLLWAARHDLPAGVWNHAHLANGYWRLYQVDAPGGRLIWPEGVIMLDPYTVYLIPSGLSLASQNELRFRQFFVHFDFLGIPPLAFQDLFRSPVAVPANTSFSDTVFRLARDAERVGWTELSTQCLIKGALYQALGYVLSNMTAEQTERFRQRVGRLQPILAALGRIHGGLDQHLSNAELAGLCSLSEDHFILRFREAVGYSPARYIMKQRVAQAAQQLLFSSRSIEEIAEEAGFGDRFYFSRVFRRETGSPPAAYRRGPRT